MVVNALLDLVNGLISWVLSLRPSWTPQMPDSVVQFYQFAEAYDNILPVNECLTIIGVFATGVTVFVTLKWGVKVVDWIADVIP